MCAQNMYPRAPLSRRHYLKVAKKSDGGVFSKLHAAPPRTWGGCAAREGGGWRGGSARAARRVAHLGGSARAARRGWWWGRHLSRRAGHCAFSSRGRRHGGVGRAAWHERGYSCCLQLNTTKYGAEQEFSVEILPVPPNSLLALHAWFGSASLPLALADGGPLSLRLTIHFRPSFKKGHCALHTMKRESPDEYMRETQAGAQTTGQASQARIYLR